jgi:outer membrane protein assembly factor BamB
MEFTEPGSGERAQTDPVRRRRWLKTIWKCDGNPPEYKVKNGKPIKYPSPDGPSEINATPVFYKNRVYVAIGQDPEHGEGVGRLLCIDATKTGDVSKTGVIWDYRGIYRSISTVSIDPTSGLLFVGDFSGYIHCLDAETGKLQWTYDMKAHMWGSTLVADGKLYAGDEDGDFVVMAATREKKLISETNLGAPVYSTPVVANGVIYVASNTHMFAFYDSARNAAVPDQPAKVKLPAPK